MKTQVSAHLPSFMHAYFRRWCGEESAEKQRDRNTERGMIRTTAESLFVAVHKSPSGKCKPDTFCSGILVAKTIRKKKICSFGLSQCHISTVLY